jgi:hypothetical protein
MEYQKDELQIFMDLLEQKIKPQIKYSNEEEAKVYAELILMIKKKYETWKSFYFFNYKEYYVQK